MSSKVRVRLAAALVVFAATACAPSTRLGPPLPPPEHPSTPEHRRVQAGHESYHRYCATCHGVAGRGNGPVAEVLRVPPSDLTRIASRRNGVFPEHEIHEFIDGRRLLRAHGNRKMPVWGDWFSGETAGGKMEFQIRARILEIVEYLKTIQVT